MADTATPADPRHVMLARANVALYRAEDALNAHDARMAERREWLRTAAIAGDVGGGARGWRERLRYLADARPDLAAAVGAAEDAVVAAVSAS